MATLCSAAFLSLLLVSDGADAPTRDFRFFSRGEGYIKQGADILTGQMNVTEAKTTCLGLPTCRAFYHEGEPTNQPVVMHFKTTTLTASSSKTPSTVYIEHLGCTATEFDHCPAQGGAQCCRAYLAEPVCSTSRSSCEMIADDTRCDPSGSDVSMCPTVYDVACCDPDKSRCRLTIDCPMSSKAKLFMSLGVMACVIVCCVLIAFFCQCKGQAAGEGSGIEAGALVTIHEGEAPATAGVVVGFDDGRSLWRVKTREGAERCVRAQDIMVVRRPSGGNARQMEMQRPLSAA